LEQAWLFIGVFLLSFSNLEQTEASDWRRGLMGQYGNLEQKNVQIAQGYCPFFSVEGGGEMGDLLGERRSWQGCVNDAY
jgi:high-affinity Fe2+/Pb2+ permease